MKLGVNGWRLRGQMTGVGRYLLNILRCWPSTSESIVFRQIRLYTPRPLGDPARELPAEIEQVVLGPDLRMLLWENLCLGPRATDDVLFCPSYSRPVLSRGKTVVTTHDATQKVHPELFPLSVRLFYNRLYGWSARRAALVITDSQAAKEDIVAHWAVPETRIRVVHLAAAEAFHPLPDRDPVLAEAIAHLDLRDPFFLFVGKLSGRRSIPLLLEGFSAFKKTTGQPHKLVIVGLNIHNLNLAGLIGQLGISEHVLYPGYLSDRDLNALYNLTTALISPSIYETVSLPVMEAQRAGAPVVCVDTRGMREITGDAAVFLSRPQASELAVALAALAEDGLLREELRAEGCEHSRRYSWQRCAAETMTVLEEAAGKPVPASKGDSVT